jgi:hypothetical protein
MEQKDAEMGLGSGTKEKAHRMNQIRYAAGLGMER